MGERVAVILAVAVVALAGCGGGAPPAATVTESVIVPSTTRGVTVAEWGGTVADDMDAIGQALSSTGEAMQERDLAAARVGCTDLRLALDSLNRKLPAPDPAVTTAFAGIVDNYGSMSQLCMTLTPFSSETEFDAMNRYLDAGNASMEDAKRVMGLG